MKAFAPGKPPFRSACRHDVEVPRNDLVSRRDGQRFGLDLIIHINEEGVAGVNPIARSSRPYGRDEDAGSWKQALDKYGFDAAFGGARRDEERAARKSAFSLRTPDHQVDPEGAAAGAVARFNTRKRKGESFRVFPLSNWTEADVGLHIALETDPGRAAVFRQAPACGRAQRRAHHARRRAPAAAAGRESPQMRLVRFRTLGCYPLTGAVESEAATLPEIIAGDARVAFVRTAPAASSTMTAPARWS